MFHCPAYQKMINMLDIPKLELYGLVLAYREDQLKILVEQPEQFLNEVLKEIKEPLDIYNYNESCILSDSQRDTCQLWLNVKKEIQDDPQLFIQKAIQILNDFIDQLHSCISVEHLEAETESSSNL